MRILLVEDEPELSTAISTRLGSQGFVVDRVGLLGEAVEAVLGADYRAIILDRRLPDGDGLSLLPILRTRQAPPPAIVLSAMDEIPERVAALNAGAEDYLAKPFAMDELLARLRVLLRRELNAAPAAEVTVGRLAYSLATSEARIAGKPLPLTRRELAILDALMRRAGRVVRRESLEEQVYGYDDLISSNALEAHISRLRKRLADNGAGVTVHGVRGIGYVLRAA